MTFKEKLGNNIWNIVFFALLGMLTIITLLLIHFAQREEPALPTIVGGVFIDSVNDNGWNQNHYEGLKDACDKLGCSLEIVEHVDENLPSARAAVETLVGKGCHVIFLTSDGFGNNISRVASDFPDISFYTVSPESDEKNVTSYFGRLYQMRYLSGIIAGMTTKTNVLGFVAAKSNPQVNRGVNAFALGARLVNPNAVVKVRLLNSWKDRERCERAAENLVDIDGADVLTFHTSTPDTLEVADDRGVFSIGYNRQYGNYSEMCLTSVIFHWDMMYKAILQDYRRGVFGKPDYYWWDASDGAVGMSDYSPLVGDEILKKLDETTNWFEEGNDVFAGRIVSNEGKIMCRKDERMSDEALLYGMNWFVDGVEVDAE